MNWERKLYINRKGIKNVIQREVGQLSTTNNSWVMKVFVTSIAPFFGQNKYTNIRRFSTIFCHKTRIFCFKNVQKIQFWVKWLQNIYLTKAKSRILSLFIENTQRKILSKISDMSKIKVQFTNLTYIVYGPKL